MAERGRPSNFSKGLADRICNALSDGKTLREICRADDMPPESTVRRWVIEDRDGFSAQYTQARELGYLAMAEELLEIANTPVEGVKTKTLPDGKVETTTGDMIEHRRLQVDTRKWLLSKALPKVYGDKLIHAGDDENPIATKDVTDVDLARRAAFLLRGSRTKGEGGVQRNGHKGNGKAPMDS